MSDQDLYPDDDCPSSWLKKRLAVARADCQSDGEWVHFADNVRVGDELWSFSSPAESWKILAGQSGVALVRDGAIIETHGNLYS